MTRRAFTLIELMVVVIIIMILVGLTVSLAGPIRQQMLARKTATAMQSISGLLSQRSAEFGGTVVVAEHPFAGSREPRLAFVRSGGGTVQTSGEALIGIALSQLSDPAAGGRLLVPDDRFSDATSPMLFGLPRRSLGVLGVPRSVITTYRRLTATESGGMVASTAKSTFLVAPQAGTAEHERAMALTLGEEGLKSLRADGILWAPPAEAPTALDGRVWSGEFPRTSQRPGSTALIAGTATPYRLLGSALYDAWGREMLCEALPDGQLRLLSAGRDGSFRFLPGPDGVLQSAASDTAPAGDDRDAAIDNVSSQPESRR
jgi:prepilin-type N-terminal cleavage/methylation domain-containing protein